MNLITRGAATILLVTGLGASTSTVNAQSAQDTLQTLQASPDSVDAKGVNQPATAVGRFFKEIADWHREPQHNLMNPNDPYHPLPDSIAKQIGVASQPSLPPQSTEISEDTVPTKKKPLGPDATSEQILSGYGHTAASLYEKHVRRGGQVIDLTTYPLHHPKYQKQNHGTSEVQGEDATPKKE